MLTYGDGSVGSNDLRAGVASFINPNFHTTKAIEPSSVSILNGVSSVIDSLAWCICDEGDGILIGRPLYAGFVSDLEKHAKITPICVEFGEDDALSVEAIAHYERAILDSARKGVPVKALLCHPHRPMLHARSPQRIPGLLFETQDSSDQ